MAYCYKIEHKVPRAASKDGIIRHVYVHKATPLESFEELIEVQFLKAVSIIKNNVLDTVQLDFHKLGHIALFGKSCIVHEIPLSEFHRAYNDMRFLKEIITGCITE